MQVEFRNVRGFHSTSSLKILMDLTISWLKYIFVYLLHSTACLRDELASIPRRSFKE